MTGPAGREGLLRMLLVSVLIHGGLVVLAASILTGGRLLPSLPVVTVEIVGGPGGRAGGPGKAASGKAPGPAKKARKGLSVERAGREVSASGIKKDLPQKARKEPQEKSRFSREGPEEKAGFSGKVAEEEATAIDVSTDDGKEAPKARQPGASYAAGTEGAPETGPFDVARGGPVMVSYQEGGINGAGSAGGSGDGGPGGGPGGGPIIKGLRKPAYPFYSRLSGEEGTVVLSVEVGPDGRAGAIEVVRSSGYPRLDRAATRALRMASFIPARYYGRPVRSKKTVAFEFRLKD